MQLKDYIQGDRKGKDANRLERDAMCDPFLQDALDGFDAVEGNHVQIIEQLEKKYTQPAIAPHRGRKLFFYWSAAASILILVGISVYFFMGQTEKTMSEIAMLQSDESREEIIIEEGSTAPLIFDSTLSAASQPDRSSRNDLSGSIDLTVSKQGETVSDKIADNEIVTEADINGNLTLQVVTDSSQLIASIIGFESQEIQPSVEEQTIELKESELTLSEVVVVGYGTQKRSAVTGAAPSASKSKAAPRTFGEKEFQDYCQQNGNKDICAGKGATVRLSFFIDETGKPTKIELRSFSCEEAKKEMENLLISSPAWTKTNRKVTMTIKW